jgi:hypothetical protein
MAITIAQALGLNASNNNSVNALIPFVVHLRIDLSYVLFPLRTPIPTVYTFLMPSIYDIHSIRIQLTKKKTPWPLVRERTIPTDRPPLVDEI